MKVAIKQSIKERNGEEAKRPDGTIATLKSIFVEALDVNEQGTDAMEKRKRNALATKIYDSTEDEIELDVSEAALIKQLVEKYYSGLVIAQVDKALA